MLVETGFLKINDMVGNGNRSSRYVAYVLPCTRITKNLSCFPSSCLPEDLFVLPDNGALSEDPSMLPGNDRISMSMLALFLLAAATKQV